MGILILTMRVHDLMHQKLDLEYKQTRLMKKIRDLQAYASTIGSGSVGITDLMSLPGTMMGRTLNYLNYANNSSIWYMQQNAPWAMQWYQAQMGAGQTPQQQMQMQNYIITQLIQQGRDKASQVEQKNLKIEEQRAQDELERLKSQLAMVDTELKSTREGRDNAIKDFAPKYA